MKKKLKPCPFCGRNDLKLLKERTVYKGFEAYITSVRCNYCNARGGTVLDLTVPYAIKNDVENRACEMWNSRKGGNE